MPLLQSPLKHVWQQHIQTSTAPMVSHPAFNHYDTQFTNGPQFPQRQQYSQPVGSAAILNGHPVSQIAGTQPHEPNSLPQTGVSALQQSPAMFPQQGAAMAGPPPITTQPLVQQMSMNPFTQSTPGAQQPMVEQQPATVVQPNPLIQSAHAVQQPVVQQPTSVQQPTPVVQQTMGQQPVMSQYAPTYQPTPLVEQPSSMAQPAPQQSAYQSSVMSPQQPMIPHQQVQFVPDYY